MYFTYTHQQNKLLHFLTSAPSGSSCSSGWQAGFQKDAANITHKSDHSLCWHEDQHTQAPRSCPSRKRITRGKGGSRKSPLPLWIKPSTSSANYHQTLHLLFIRKLGQRESTTISSNWCREWPGARRDRTRTKARSKLLQAAGLSDLTPSPAIPVTLIWRCQPWRGADLPGRGGRKYQGDELQCCGISSTANHSPKALLESISGSTVYLQNSTKTLWPIYLNDCASVTRQTRQNGFKVIKIAQLSSYPSPHVMASPAFQRML